MARHYYYIDSCGEDTNLQLYALKQAKLYWAALQHDLTQVEDCDYFHERCIFIICTMGLSVSQLLGQNNPTPSGRVPSPKDIFEALVDKHGLKPELKQVFRDFIETYDRCRHFGLTNDGSRHWHVSQVTLDKTRELYEFGLEVWKAVIDIYRRDPESDLEHLNLDQVEKDLP